MLSQSEFQVKARALMRPRFVAPPLASFVEYTIARNRFKQEQLHAALALARQNSHLREARAKQKVWERKLALLEQAIVRIDAARGLDAATSRPFANLRKPALSLQQA